MSRNDDLQMARFEESLNGLPKSCRHADWLDETYYRLRPDFGVFFRKQRMTAGFKHTDCIPNFWLYACKDFRGEIGFLRNGKQHDLWGPLGLFIPPFSIINWIFNCDEFRWASYQGTGPITTNLSDEPIFFPAQHQSFSCDSEIRETVLQRRSSWQSLAAKKVTSSVGRRTKCYIDVHFQELLKISQIADRLGFSSDVMTRQFKGMYGITPSVYLRDLKYYQSALQITTSKQSMRAISSDMGLPNYENFSKVFKTVFQTSPRNFRVQSNIDA